MFGLGLLLDVRWISGLAGYFAMVPGTSWLIGSAVPVGLLIIATWWGVWWACYRGVRAARWAGVAFSAACLVEAGYLFIEVLGVPGGMVGPLLFHATLIALLMTKSARAYRRRSQRQIEAALDETFK